MSYIKKKRKKHLKIFHAFFKLQLYIWISGVMTSTPSDMIFTRFFQSKKHYLLLLIIRTHLFFPFTLQYIAELNFNSRPLKRHLNYSTGFMTLSFCCLWSVGLYLTFLFEDFDAFSSAHAFILYFLTWCNIPAFFWRFHQFYTVIVYWKWFKEQYWIRCWQQINMIIIFTIIIFISVGIKFCQNKKSLW